MHPQGGIKKVLLGESLAKAAPFYLKVHKPTILRKIPVDTEAYQSVMENARKRFEDQVIQNQAYNQKNLDQFHELLTETSKYNELKEIKERQKKAINKTVLEQQMANTKDQRLASRDAKRTVPNQLNFGPKETDETIQFKRLKKKLDQDEVNSHL